MSRGFERYSFVFSWLQRRMLTACGGRMRTTTSARLSCERVARIPSCCGGPLPNEHRAVRLPAPTA